jgi:leucyl-tRNA synthetase
MIVDEWGADTARLFVLFKAPPQLGALTSHARLQ